MLASGGILSVGSITIVILLLISDRGWRNGLAYMLGYVGAYTLIGVSFVLAGYRLAENRSTESGAFLPFLFVILGLLLLWITQRNLRKPPAVDNQSPRLFAIVDRITPQRAFAFGALVTVLNFKNLAIFASAIGVSVVSGLPLLSKLAVSLLVVLVFCTSVIVPVFIYVAFPRQADQRLNWIKETLETHRRAIGIWVPLLFGLLFLIQGLVRLL